MIISLQNKKTFEDMGHINPCTSESGCPDNDIVASMFRSMASSNHRNHTIRFRVTDQTESAIIYVAVVMIFYAAIIILLLGTSGKRLHSRSKSRSRHRSASARHQMKTQTMAVYLGDHSNHTEVVKTHNQTITNSMTKIDMNEPEAIATL